VGSGAVGDCRGSRDADTPGPALARGLTCAHTVSHRAPPRALAGVRGPEDQRIGLTGSSSRAGGVEPRPHRALPSRSPVPCAGGAVPEGRCQPCHITPARSADALAQGKKARLACHVRHPVPLGRRKSSGRPRPAATARHRQTSPKPRFGGIARCFLASFALVRYFLAVT
jgi:hypothetical protein